MSHLRKLGDKKWKIVIDLGYDEEGKRIRKYKTVNLPKPEARDLMHELEKKYKEGQNIDDNIKLSTHLKEWIDTHSSEISPTTEESYRNQINAYLIPHLGDIKLKDLNTKTIDDFYTKMLLEGKKKGEGGLSKRSVRYLHTILNKALKKADSWDRLKKNPAEGTSPPKRQRNKNKKINPEHLIEIITLAEEEIYREIYEFALRTGLRRGEILGLTWSDIFWERRLISVNKTLVRLDHKGFVLKDLTKNDTAYTIPAGEKVIDLLEKRKEKQEKYKKQLKDNYKDDGFIFCWEDGSLIDVDTVTHSFKRYAVKAGYEQYTFHDLRHGFATIQVLAGTHTKTLQRLLGHKTKQVTDDQYSHITAGPKTDAAEKIDEYF
ncbi:MAG: tyrosine-type recombinase/integrase [bacterium]